MKIVSIDGTPTGSNREDALGYDETSLDTIVAHIKDGATGQNHCLRAYIYALRDLQVAHNKGKLVWGCGDKAAIDRAGAAIDQARAAVAVAFDALIVAEFRVNRPMSSF